MTISIFNIVLEDLDRTVSKENNKKKKTGIRSKDKNPITYHYYEIIY